MLDSNQQGPWNWPLFQKPASYVGTEIGRGRRVITPREGFSWQGYRISTRSALPTLTIHDIALLSDLYTFRDFFRISRFLSGHLKVAAFLMASYSHISNVAPGMLRPALHVLTDPESGGERLFLLLPTTLPVKEARRILRQLDQKWWLAASEQISEQLMLDVEYV